MDHCEQPKPEAEDTKTQTDGLLSGPIDHCGLFLRCFMHLVAGKVLDPENHLVPKSQIRSSLTLKKLRGYLATDAEKARFQAVCKDLKLDASEFDATFKFMKHHDSPLYTFGELRSKGIAIDMPAVRKISQELPNPAMSDVVVNATHVYADLCKQSGMEACLFDCFPGYF